MLSIHGEREAPLCMVALGRTASESRQAAQPAPLKLETVALSQNEVSYDDLLKMHRASRLVSTEEVSAVASARVEPHAPAVFHPQRSATRRKQNLHTHVRTTPAQRGSSSPAA